MSLEHLIGIGARVDHFYEIINTKPSIGWLEVHSENFFSQGGLLLEILDKLAAAYPLSFHGVGLSLGRTERLDLKHLEQLRFLQQTYNPRFFSEHLSWGFVQGQYLPDLLPLPYTKETLENFKRNISQAQDFLKRELLIENPSSYFEYRESTMTEVEFLSELCQQSGCSLLLDVNNVYVSCKNHGWDSSSYIDLLPSNLVKEIHLAGHSSKTLSTGEEILIDTHDQPVCDEVWALYEKALEHFGSQPTLLEFDAQIPPLENLISQAKEALKYLQKFELKSTVLPDL